MAEMAPGPDRARVLLRLAIVRYWAESQPAGVACAQQAMVEAGPVSVTLAEAHALVAQLCHHSNLERETHAQQAIDLLARQAQPDPRILSAALVGQPWPVTTPAEAWRVTCWPGPWSWRRAWPSDPR